MSKLISQGAYGCVYKPGIKADGTKESSKYVSKIQLNKDRTENEPIIGKIIIEKINNHERYFAPALSVHRTTPSVIKSSERSKCKILDEKKKQDFVSVKIKYVGKDTLHDHMKNHKETNNFSFLQHMLDTHIYLACAVEELSKQKIVHHDIKANNVMYNDQQKLPILIDFGVSFQLSELFSEEVMRTVFFTSYEKYPPWCFEVICIGSIVKETGWEKRKVKGKKLESHLSTYLENNPIISIQKNIADCKKKWKTYINTLDNMCGKKAVNELLEKWNTWDMYSVNVMYLMFVYNYGWYDNVHPCIKPYVDYLVSQITCIPSKRNDASTTISELQKLVHGIKKIDYVSFQEES
jgi:serine/threonine protein kinase